MFDFLLATIGILAGASVTLVLVLLLRKSGQAAPETVQRDIVAERVRAVGKLIGLEVHAKEIVTSKKGWAWMPPILLSQAKIAMIFHFEKQYYIDLSRLRREDVVEYSPGAFRITLPPIEGALRLTDVSPYDIQAGRILGLLDVIQMNAETQKNLMGAAREEAADLFNQQQAGYLNEARHSVERHLETLFSFFDFQVDIEWTDESPREEDMAIEAGLSEKLVNAGAN